MVEWVKHIKESDSKIVTIAAIITVAILMLFLVLVLIHSLIWGIGLVFGFETSYKTTIGVFLIGILVKILK